VKLEGAKLPHAKVSKTFSVEGVWDEKPLGYHVGWLGVHHGQVSVLGRLLDWRMLILDFRFGMMKIK
jgi:hypothetical protein